MAKQKITGLSASLLQQQAPQQQTPTHVHDGAPPSAPANDFGRPVVQTVKVPPDVYIRLKTIGARERRSSQDIILSAVREYLDRFPMSS